MAVHEVSGRELVELLASPLDTALGEVVVVDGVPTGPARPPGVRPCVIVGRAGWPSATAERAALVDVIADDDAITEIVATAQRAPLASVAVATLLRGAEQRSIAEGLVAESATYSTLQAGPEFAHWRRTTPVRDPRPSTGAAVRVARQGDELTIELDRPEVRNALGVELRDELLAALAIAEADPSLSIVLRGAGPAFCSGGHLDEFGTAPDPATAHAVRLARSIGAVLAGLSDRVTAQLHGACIGSGIELPAFCGRVIAAADTTIALPELGFGLIPGAGGTVSLPRRIGRHRTAWLALTRLPIDAGAALRWGLVDAVTA